MSNHSKYLLQLVLWSGATVVIYLAYEYTAWPVMSNGSVNPPTHLLIHGTHDISGGVQKFLKNQRVQLASSYLCNCSLITTVLHLSASGINLTWLLSSTGRLCGA